MLSNTMLNLHIRNNILPRKKKVLNLKTSNIIKKKVRKAVMMDLPWSRVDRKRKKRKQRKNQEDLRDQGLKSHTESMKIAVKKEGTRRERKKEVVIKKKAVRKVESIEVKADHTSLIEEVKKDLEEASNMRRNMK